MEPQSIGFASCTGGHPDSPDLSAYPLLVWVDGEVKTEDGKATVDEIKRMLPTLDNPGVLAQSFESTEEHIKQAIRYAQRGGV
jgi:hypothetical protein